MLKHACACAGLGTHIEHPGRLQSIYSRLQAVGLVTYCQRVKSRKATMAELQSVHRYVVFMMVCEGMIFKCAFVMN